MSGEMALPGRVLNKRPKQVDGIPAVHRYPGTRVRPTRVRPYPGTQIPGYRGYPVGIPTQADGLGRSS
eukprot:909146-Rhodomonas_salina.1